MDHVADHDGLESPLMGAGPARAQELAGAKIKAVGVERAGHNEPVAVTRGKTRAGVRAAVFDGARNAVHEGYQHVVRGVFEESEGVARKRLDRHDSHMLHRRPQGIAGNRTRVIR